MELASLVNQHRGEVLKIQSTLQALKKEHAACYDLLVARLSSDRRWTRARKSRVGDSTVSGAGTTLGGGGGVQGVGGAPSSMASPRPGGGKKNQLLDAEDDGDDGADEDDVAYRGGLLDLLQAFLDKHSSETTRYRTHIEAYEREIDRLQGVAAEHARCVRLMQSAGRIASMDDDFDSYSPAPNADDGALVANGGANMPPPGVLFAEMRAVLDELNAKDRVTPVEAMGATGVHGSAGGSSLDWLEALQVDYRATREYVDSLMPLDGPATGDGSLAGQAVLSDANDVLAGVSSLRDRVRAVVGPYYTQYQECIAFLRANFYRPVDRDGNEVSDNSLLHQIMILTEEYSNNIDTYHAVVHEYQATAKEVDDGRAEIDRLRNELELLRSDYDAAFSIASGGDSSAQDRGVMLADCVALLAAAASRRRRPGDMDDGDEDEDEDELAAGGADDARAGQAASGAGNDGVEASPAHGASPAAKSGSPLSGPETPRTQPAHRPPSASPAGSADAVATIAEPAAVVPTPKRKAFQRRLNTDRTERAARAKATMKRAPIVPAPSPAQKSVASPTSGTGGGPPLDSLSAPDQRYDAGPVLGTGSFAVVKTVKDRFTTQTYAAKIVDKTRWLKYLDCIQREVDILRTLRHEHIIRLREVIDLPNTLYMITELAPGGDLLDHIERHGPLNEAQARNVIGKTALALEYLHDVANVVHRDMKPENILLGGGGPLDPAVKLCDFGHSAFAPRTEAGTPAAASGTSSEAFGTFIYLAPEVIVHKTYGRPMDMWSLGVILYIMFSGQFPFDGQTDEELFDEIVRGQYNFNDQCWSVIGQAAKDVVCSLLTVDPARRWTAAQLYASDWVQGRIQ